MSDEKLRPALDAPSRPAGLDLPGASAMVGEIRAGRLCAREAVENSLEMIEHHNGPLNAIVLLDAEAARARADELDARRASGRANGPLDGLPMTIKEAFDLAGMPTSWGIPEFKDNFAKEDSVVAQRLKAAGAILLGKTNLPQGMEDWETDNQVYGATRNPWDLSRSAGGSSGGGAAAVASGMVAADIGSDQGGSIRIPAHYCGIYGLKPTWNLIPMTGHSLQNDLRAPDINVVGPLTRDPEDLALLLAALAGPDDPAKDGWRLHLPQPETRPLSSYRVATLPDHPDCPIDQSCLEVIGRFLEALKRHGVAMEETTPPDIDFARATEIMNLLVRSETATRMTDVDFAKALSTAEESENHENNHIVRNARGAGLRHRDWLRIHEERQCLRRAWEKFFRRFDAFLCPVASVVAPPLAPGSDILRRMIEVNGQAVPMLDQHFWAAIAGLPYLPAVVTPIGQTEGGLPVGIQIIGPAFHDLRVIALASLIARGETVS